MSGSGNGRSGYGSIYGDHTTQYSCQFCHRAFIGIDAITRHYEDHIAAEQNAMMQQMNSLHSGASWGAVSYPMPYASSSSAQPIFNYPSLNLMDVSRTPSSSTGPVLSFRPSRVPLAPAAAPEQPQTLSITRTYIAQRQINPAVIVPQARQVQQIPPPEAPQLVQEGERRVNEVAAAPNNGNARQRPAASAPVNLLPEVIDLVQSDEEEEDHNSETSAAEDSGDVDLTLRL